MAVEVPRTTGSQTTTSPSSQLGSLSLRQPVHVNHEATLQAAAELMRRENISSLVVDTEPASFLTERDLVRALAEGRAFAEPVGTVATRGPVWVPRTLTLAQAAAVMVHTGLRHLMVLDLKGDVVGVLSIRDVFEVLAHGVDPDGWLSAFGAALGDVG